VSVINLLSKWLALCLFLCLSVSNSGLAGRVLEGKLCRSLGRLFQIKLTLETIYPFLCRSLTR